MARERERISIDEERLLKDQLFTIIEDEDLNEDQKLEQIKWLEHLEYNIADIIFISTVCCKGYVKIFDYLYKKNHNILYFAESILHEVVSEGHLEMVKYFLSLQPALINKLNCFHQSIMHTAAENGHIELVKYLLLIKSEWIDMLNSFEQSVLHSAAQSGSKELAEYLLFIKPELIDILDRQQQSVLHAAAQSGNKELVEYLLSKKPELIDKLDRFQTSVLNYATQSGNIELVKFLLLNKPELIGILDHFGQSVLHIAIQGGSKQLVEYFLSINPALIDMQINWDGHTPLHTAFQNDHFDIADILIKKGANLSITTYGNQTPADLITNRELRDKYKKLEMIYKICKTLKFEVETDKSSPDDDEEDCADAYAGCIGENEETKDLAGDVDHI